MKKRIIAQIKMEVSQISKLFVSHKVTNILGTNSFLKAEIGIHGKFPISHLFLKSEIVICKTINIEYVSKQKS